MRIMFLLDKLSPGGTQRHLLRLVRGLCGQGEDVVVYCLDCKGKWGKQLEAEGFRVEAMGITNVIPWRSKSLFKRLATAIELENPAVLHNLLFSANFVGPIAARLAKCSPAVIASRRDTGFWMKYYHAWSLRLANLWVDRICVNSEAVKVERMKKEGEKSEKFSVIFNGVSMKATISQQQVRANLGVNENDFVLTSVARLRVEKGQELLLRAAAVLLPKCPELKILLVGDGPQREYLRQLSQSLALEQCLSFLGHREDVADILAASDVMALMSDSEGFSNAIIEAMAMAKPVVASAAGGNVEAVEDEGSGYLVKPGDVDAAAVAILKLYQDKELAVRLGQRGRVLAETVYSCERELSAYLKLYAELMLEAEV